MRIQLLLLLVTLLLLTTCRKKEEITCPEDEYWEITEKAEAEVAYKGDEELRYLYITDSTQDTVVFQGRAECPIHQYVMQIFNTTLEEYLAQPMPYVNHTT